MFLSQCTFIWPIKCKVLIKFYLLNYFLRNFKMMEYAKKAIINPLLPSPRINSYNYTGIFDFYLEK